MDVTQKYSNIVCCRQQLGLFCCLSGWWSRNNTSIWKRMGTGLKLQDAAIGHIDDLFMI